MNDVQPVITGRLGPCANGATHFCSRHYADVLGYVDSSVDDVQLHWQVQALRFEFFARNPPHNHVRAGLVAKRAGSALIAENHLLPHLKVPAGVPPCPLYSLRRTSVTSYFQILMVKDAAMCAILERFRLL